MALVISPTTLSFPAVTVPPTLSGVGTTQTLAVTGDSPYTGAFTVTVIPANVCSVVPAQGAVVGTYPYNYAVTALYPGTAIIYISDGTNTTQCPVTVVPLTTTSGAGIGYTDSAAMNMVYLRTNENSTGVSVSNVMSLLNAGLNQVSDSLGAQLENYSIPLASGQNVVALPYDIQDITSASYSILTPATSGTQVYPLTQMEQRTFMDFSGGVPGTGFGPPLAYFVSSDFNGFQIVQLYPPSGANGFLNVYYRARASQWPLTPTGTSYVNADPQAQEGAILWACARVCEAREKYSISTQFDQQYEAWLEKYRDIIRRRTAPKSGMVRDVVSLGHPGYPPWWDW